MISKTCVLMSGTGSTFDKFVKGYGKCNNWPDVLFILSSNYSIL